MKYFFLLLLITTNATAQKQYGDFIQQDDSIQWAAEYTQILNLTPKLAKYSIREQAFKKANEKGCIESFKIVNENFVKSEFCLADTVSKSIIISSNTNPYKIPLNLHGDDLENFYKKESANSFSNNAFKSSFQIDEVKQILYYKNAQLYITNVLVSPLYLESAVDTTILTSVFNWKKYYSVCNNIEPSKKITPSAKKKLIYLGQASVMYNFLNNVDDETRGFKVFTKLKQGFYRTLYKDIINNKVTAVDEYDKIIEGKKIKEVKNPAIEVPIFDSSGNQNGSKLMFNEINTDSFYYFKITQDVYLDTVKNVLISEVKYLDVSKNVYTDFELYLGIGFYFRIYFIKPSHFKKLKTKAYMDD